MRGIALTPTHLGLYYRKARKKTLSVKSGVSGSWTVL